ncbi:hypothetical protein FOA52_010208 [Chlamydomonas sp. UWO 241]|nr:hypothetical protein FOA52_010208 [Chlamydomonas sp. UWO 241]
MSTKYGVFNENKYMADPEEVLGEGGTRSKVEFDATGGGNREKGLNFKTPTAKTGKSASFGKFLTNAVGDKYVDPLKLELQGKVAGKALNVSEAPFKAPSAVKKSACPGDYHGTCTGKATPYMSQGDVDNRKKGDFPEKPKGIYTSPGKKGTYGMNKYTLSERAAGVKGVANEYAYEHDPDTEKRARHLAEMEASHKAMASDHPFVPSNLHASQRINKIPYICAPPPLVGRLAEIAAAKAAVEAGLEPPPEKASVEPFRPSNIHVAKRVNPIPYEHDPEAPKLEAAKTKRLEESKRIAAQGAWRPNMGGNKSDMVRSVVRMNIPRC